MKALIKKNAYIWATDYFRTAIGAEFKQWLKDNEGKWIDIETDCLFDNQYNTEKYRIYDSMIDAISDDARINKGKCKYCGTMVNAGETCEKYADCKDYGIDWFTPTNTYFLKYPNGAKNIQHDYISCRTGYQKFGTYHLEAFKDLDYYRISNCKKTINFKFDGEKYYIHNGIGYTEKSFLDIPYSIRGKVLAKLQELQKEIQ